MTDLGTLGGDFGFAGCANNRGQVIGQSSLAEHPGACFTGEPGCHAFFWDREILKDLGTFGGDNAVAHWLNDADEVVCTADLPGSQVQHASLWKNGTMTDLGTLATNSRALAINSDHEIVGISCTRSPQECPESEQRNLHAFVWKNGGPMIDLNSLIPANSNLPLVRPFNINDRGEILGFGLPPGIKDPAFGGHLFLLIPCRDDKGGCEDNAAGATAATQSNPASIVTNNITTSTQDRPTPIDAVTAWRTRPTQRYRIPGLEAPWD